MTKGRQGEKGQGPMLETCLVDYKPWLRRYMVVSTRPDYAVSYWMREVCCLGGTWLQPGRPPRARRNLPLPYRGMLDAYPR